MSIIRKMLVVCDRCGASREIPLEETDPFSPASMSGVSKEWYTLDRVHHLCPECGAAYKSRKAEMERELKMLAGIKTIEIDL